jgi:hypothetical protein
LSLQELFALVCCEKSRKTTRARLPSKVELAKETKVLVTNNIATDLDITNGARGIIVDIILHPEEPPIGSDSIVALKRIPLCVLIKLTKTRASHLDRLEEGVVPIEPLTS